MIKKGEAYVGNTCPLQIERSVYMKTDLKISGLMLLYIKNTQYRANKLQTLLITVSDFTPAGKKIPELNQLRVKYCFLYTYS